MNILDQLLEADPLPEPSSILDGRESSFQLDIFAAARNASEHLLVDAKAGSGKTTTIEKTMRFSSGSNLYLAFNKSVVEEAKVRVGSCADVRTLNSLGFGVFRRHRPKAELNSRKTLDALKQIMPAEQFEEFGYRLSRAIGLAKSNALDIDSPATPEQFKQIIESYDLEVPFERLDEYSFLACEAFQRAQRNTAELDFDDQIYVPLREDWRLRYYSNVFVDEAQDLNPLQHLLLRRMSSEGSRIIAVGDRHQAIYGFRGALTNSMELLKQQFGARELPLSISYRCSKSVIREAQKLCPDIQHRDGAPDGKVSWQSEIEPDIGESQNDPLYWSDDWLILSRNNAPLFRAVLVYVRAKRPCRVLSNALETLSSFIRSLKATTGSELEAKLDRWFSKEREGAASNRSKLAMLTDKYETVRLLAREFKLVAEIHQLLDRLATSRSGTMFSTIHKAKGLEADHVYLLRPDLCPSPFATTPEQRQQELNLLYVAITRAKLSFTYGVGLL